MSPSQLQTLQTVKSLLRGKFPAFAIVAVADVETDVQCVIEAHNTRDAEDIALTLLAAAKKLPNFQSGQSPSAN